MRRTLSLREKAMLAGLYLSEFDAEGLRYLGFGSFTEAFNVIGHALGAQPASVKNYRDEFDPLFPNERKGWHKRPMREHCKAVYDTFRDLQLGDFAALLKEAIYKGHEIDVLMESVSDAEGGARDSFARRLVTGQAAEQYFKSKYKEVELFDGFQIEDTTRLGCGFDFRPVSPHVFYGIEVKGLNERTGSISMTSKEHAVASLLGSRYFLFVVKNFRERPFHEVHKDPLRSHLMFTPVEHRAIEVNWVAKV